MIIYHGTPFGGPNETARAFFPRRHAFVSWYAPKQLGVVQEVAASYSIDNGAFSFFNNGKKPNWKQYYSWVEAQRSFSNFDFAIIPDVIDGDTRANDRLIEQWPWPGSSFGVPVYHLHEPLSRLARLAQIFERVAIGSSGQFWRIKSPHWWARMNEVMHVVCDGDGRPRVKLHGLRMLDIEVTSVFPFSSGDSTLVGRNVTNPKYIKRYPGEPAQRAEKIAALAESVLPVNRYALRSITQQGSLFGLQSEGVITETCRNGCFTDTYTDNGQQAPTGTRFIYWMGCNECHPEPVKAFFSSDWQLLNEFGETSGDYPEIPTIHKIINDTALTGA